MKIEGIMPALVSPLNSDETVNLSVLQNLIEYFLQKGANGFYLAGATGEGLAINPDQRRLLAERAVETVKDRVPCIVQVASTDFGEVLCTVEENHQRLVKIEIDRTVKTLTLRPISTYGSGQARIFSFDFE